MGARDLISMDLYSLEIRDVSGQIVTSAHNVPFSAVNLILSELQAQPYMGGTTNISIAFRGRL